jgi:hypothetical protein
MFFIRKVVFPAAYVSTREEVNRSGTEVRNDGGTQRRVVILVVQYGTLTEKRMSSPRLEDLTWV